MANEIMPVDQHEDIQAVDSLMANEFTLAINGEPVSGVFTVSGLVSFKLEVKATNQLRKINEPFKITKMVQRDPHNPFNVWLRETFEAGTDIVRPTRTLTIQAVDDGVVTRTWTVKKAWVCEVGYSEFNTASSELIEERVYVRFDDIEESWPLLNG